MRRPAINIPPAELDLIVTGALGHCPLYRKLGYTPPLRGERHAYPRHP
jgi:hypothetical protein